MKLFITCLTTVVVMYFCRLTTAVTLDPPVLDPDLDVYDIEKLMDDRNAELMADALDFRVLSADVYTTDQLEGMTVLSELGREVLQKDTGNKKLDNRFVPGDSRRSWNQDPSKTITYASYGFMGNAASSLVDNAMGTWNNVKCLSNGRKKMSIVEQGSGIRILPLFFGGIQLPPADINHVGFLSSEAIDLLGIPPSVIAFHVGFIWITDEGDPSDIDDNGYLDKAFDEIYYNAADFDGKDFDADFETVALHEAGHGLCLEHFGTISIDKKGNLVRNPKAVMNAIYGGPLKSLQTTDKAGICGLYQKWPNS